MSNENPEATVIGLSSPRAVLASPRATIGSSHSLHSSSASSSGSSAAAAFAARKAALLSGRVPCYGNAALASAYSEGVKAVSATAIGAENLVEVQPEELPGLLADGGNVSKLALFILQKLATVAAHDADADAALTQAFASGIFPQILLMVAPLCCAMEESVEQFFQSESFALLALVGDVIELLLSPEVMTDARKEQIQITSVEPVTSFLVGAAAIVRVAAAERVNGTISIHGAIATVAFKLFSSIRPLMAVNATAMELMHPQCGTVLAELRFVRSLLAFLPRSVGTVWSYQIAHLIVMCTGEQGFCEALTVDDAAGLKTLLAAIGSTMHDTATVNRLLTAVSNVAETERHAKLIADKAGFEVLQPTILSNDLPTSLACSFAIASIAAYPSCAEAAETSEVLPLIDTMIHSLPAGLVASRVQYSPAGGDDMSTLLKLLDADSLSTLKLVGLHYIASCIAEHAQFR
jgi:hypothetical protein